jgi:hypothetical protein
MTNLAQLHPAATTKLTTFCQQPQRRTAGNGSDALPVRRFSNPAGDNLQLTTAFVALAFAALAALGVGGASICLFFGGTLSHGEATT